MFAAFESTQRPLPSGTPRPCPLTGTLQGLPRDRHVLRHLEVEHARDDEIGAVLVREVEAEPPMRLPPRIRRLMLSLPSDPRGRDWLWELRPACSSGETGPSRAAWRIFSSR